MKAFSLFAAAAIALCLPTAAMAQKNKESMRDKTRSTWNTMTNTSYFKITGEAITDTESDIDASSGPLSASGSGDYDTGWGVAAALGYEANDMVDAELEVAYRNTELDNVSIGGLTATGNDLDLETVSGMVNVYLHPIKGWVLDPYIGGGAGIAYKASGDEDTVFAYQGMAGLDLDLTDRSSIFGGYRYFATDDFETSSGATNINLDVEQHIIEIGYKRKL